MTQDISKKIEQFLFQTKNIKTKNPSTAYEIGCKALDLVRTHDVREKEGDVLLQLISVCHASSMLDKAFDYVVQAKDIFLSRNDEDGMMRLDNMLGVMLSYNGFFERALYHFESALKRARQLQNKKLIVATINNIGEIHKRCGDLEKALDIFFKAESVAKEAGLLERLSVILSNIGDVFVKMGRLDEAEDTLKKAYGFQSCSKNLNYTSDLHINFGRLYKKQGDFERARFWLEKSVKQLEKIENQAYLIDAYLELYDIGQIEGKANILPYLIDAREIATRLKAHHRLSSVENKLHVHYEKEKEYEKALFHFKEYHNLLQKLEATNLILKLKIFGLESAHTNPSKEVNSFSDILREEIKMERNRLYSLESENMKLSYEAFHDKLTGLYNRRGIDKELEKIENSAKIKDVDSVLLYMLDLDYFKIVNDNMGHSYGDLCLRRVGLALGVMAEACKGFAGRYGGEEFLFVCKNISFQRAMEIGENLIRAIKTLDIEYESETGPAILTISAGGIYVQGNWTVSLVDLTGQADNALYEAKKRGRSGFVLRPFGHATEEEVSYFRLEETI